MFFLDSLDSALKDVEICAGFHVDSLIHVLGFSFSSKEHREDGVCFLLTQH
jgi:hypothetical protein